MKRTHPRQEKGPTFEELSDDENHHEEHSSSSGAGSVRYEDPDDDAVSK